MDEPDLNLLRALDMLLAEGSVTGAARRLGLSSSAMSRTLTRLRAATGDPLLVRAGRSLVPTPKAEEMRERVRLLAQDVRAVLSPQSDAVDVGGMERIFTIRAGEGFIEIFSIAIVMALTSAAPRSRIRFTPKPEKNAHALREGEVDLEIGVADAYAPEVRAQLIFRDRFVGAARTGHPLLARPITAERYAACQHVGASRRGTFLGPVDDALADLGFSREVVVVVPGFSDALRIARHSDLIALVPGSCIDGADPAVEGLEMFALPIDTPEIAVSAMWHPRMEADPGHRWFRAMVIATCRKAPVSV